MRDDLLDPRAVLLRESAPDRDAAIRRCGRALVDVGAAAEPYIEAMLERERSISTYVGEGVAIPHGTNASKGDVQRDAICVVRFPGGVDWDGEQVTLCVGIAAKDDGHVQLLSQLAEILLDPDRARALREATEVSQVMKELT
ncbi:PTS sugar transporter subunit IIA [Nonomuraea longispora]|uniref:Mannitol-specific phosphotransferase enzyme IIA component n=1 Tax=Nonomuraea longispora TaxID=1848320 RepID=A0A4R4MWC7_9ACTN|nr:PTS sugar transporter subunit IIA [Nonomuraea longispora]TDB98699.1 PTS sugar transporter subunit IIA [Nonomuraea longispora]